MRVNVSRPRNPTLGTPMYLRAYTFDIIERSHPNRDVISAVILERNRASAIRAEAALRSCRVMKPFQFAFGETKASMLKKRGGAKNVPHRLLTMTTMTVADFKRRLLRFISYGPTKAGARNSLCNCHTDSTHKFTARFSLHLREWVSQHQVCAGSCVLR